MPRRIGKGLIFAAVAAAVLITILPPLATAYDQSLGDCVKVAKEFDNTCDPGSAYDEPAV